MVLSSLCVALVVLASFSSGLALAQDAVLRVLPQPDREWELIASSPKDVREAKSGFQWTVYRHRTTGDFLSVAIHPESGKRRAVEYLTDTALEIFPEGWPVWTHPASDVEVDVIATSVVDAGRMNAALKGQQMLRYCFISQAQGRGNLMAQGRAWAGAAGTVFVQHTSSKPVTSAFVEEFASSIAAQDGK